MSKQLLDETDIGPVLVHERRKGMAEQMAGSLLADLQGLQVVAGKSQWPTRCPKILEHPFGTWLNSDYPPQCSELF